MLEILFQLFDKVVQNDDYKQQLNSEGKHYGDLFFYLLSFYFH